MCLTLLLSFFGRWRPCFLGPISSRSCRDKPSWQESQRARYVSPHLLKAALNFWKKAKKETKGRGAGGEERSAVYKVAALGEKLQFLQISYRNKRMLILLSPSYFFLDQDSSTKFFPSQYFFHFRFVITVFLESLIGSRKNRKSSLRSIVVKLRTCSVFWRISNHWSTKVSCFLIYRGNEN